LNEYTLLSFVIEGTLLLGVSLAILIFHTLNLYVKRSRTLEAFQILGGLLIAIGMTYTRTIYSASGVPRTDLVIAVLLTLGGGLLIILPFFAFKPFKTDGELKAQVFALLLSPVIYWFSPLPPLGKTGATLILFGTLLIVLLLMGFVSSLAACTCLSKNILRVASWLLVFHAWLRYYAFKNPQTCIHYGVLLIYFISLLLWVYSTLETYEVLRRWL